MTWSEVDHWIEKHGGLEKIFPRQPDLADLIDRMRECAAELRCALESHNELDEDALKVLDELEGLIGKVDEHDCAA